MISLSHVLVATDFGQSADTALTYGRELARTFGAKLHVLHVVDNIVTRVAPGAGFPEFLVNVAAAQSQMESAGREAVDKLLTDDDRTALHAIGTVVTSADPARAIIDHAEEVHADVIVVGTHGRTALARFFVGSVAERVTRLASCPVLVVRQPEHEFIRPDALEKVPAV